MLPSWSIRLLTSVSITLSYTEYRWWWLFDTNDNDDDDTVIDNNIISINMTNVLQYTIISISQEQQCNDDYDYDNWWWC